MMPPPEDIVVEEFFNYHRHDIPLPQKKDAISLDVRWGTSVTNAAHRHAYLQVGLATKRDVDLNEVRPLNLAVVIDASGSMQGDRIRKVKQSLRAFLEKLRDIDRGSVVTFNSSAKTIVAPQYVDDPRSLGLAIDGIFADGGTNLHAGLMLGYKMVQRNLDPRLNNRVILLTDGQANNGVTDSEEIAKQSQRFNRLGINLSAIGLGHDFNQALLRQLARSGRGLIHFVGDDKDIKKVFIDELDGLLSSVGRDLNLAIDYDERLTVDQIYGYSPQFGAKRIQFDLDPLNAGTTQIVLLRFRVPDHIKRSTQFPISVRLNYQSTITEKDVSIPMETELKFFGSDRRPLDPLTDSRVRRNVTIADLAQSMKQMATLLKDERYADAKTGMRRQLDLTASRYPMSLDKEVVRTRELAVGYLRKIEAAYPNK